MAKNNVDINKTVHGVPLSLYIENLPGVQAVTRSRANEIEAAAEEVLQRQYRFSGATTVNVDRMRNRGRFAPGWKVTMIDRGEGYARAIEFGRKDYLTVDEAEMRYTTRKIRRGFYQKIKLLRVPGVPYGGMEGLYIMQKAVDIVKIRHRSEFR